MAEFKAGTKFYDVRTVNVVEIFGEKCVEIASIWSYRGLKRERNNAMRVVPRDLSRTTLFQR